MGISAPKVFLRSLLFSYLLSAILLIAVSFGLYKLRLQESQVRLAVNAVYILSCALAGFLAGKGMRKGRFFCGVIAGLLYFAVLLAVSVLLNKGLTATPQELAAAAGFCAGSGIIGGVLS